MSVALLYVRQSGDKAKRGEATVSPQMQEDSCRRLPEVAASDVVEVFVDLNVSGGKRARVGFDALLARMRELGAECRVIASYDQSRLFRSSRIALEFHALLSEPAYQHVAVSYVHGAPFARTPAGGLTFTMVAAVNQYERDMNAVRARETKRAQLLSGEMVGHVPPGYRRIADTSGLRYEVHEEEAELVRRIFELYARGEYTVRGVAHLMADEGVPVPAGWRAGVWWWKNVREMLSNPTYIGLVATSARAAHWTGVRPNSFETPIRGRWESIIDAELWETVQTRLAEKFRPHTGRKPWSLRRRFAFHGLSSCAVCGGRMSVRLETRDGGREVVSYRCKHARAGCYGFHEERLIAWGRSLFAWLESRASAEEWREGLAEGRAALAAQEDSGRRSPDALSSVVSALERLGKRFDWGHITEDEYRAEHDRLAALRAEIEEELLRPVKASTFGSLSGVLAAWDSGDAGVRNDMLRRLFVGLRVEVGEGAREAIGKAADREAVVVGYAAHPGQEAELAALLGGWELAPVMTELARKVRVG